MIKAVDYRIYGIAFDFMRFEGLYAMGGMEVVMDLGYLQDHPPDGNPLYLCEDTQGQIRGVAQDRYTRPEAGGKGHWGISPGTGEKQPGLSVSSGFRPSGAAADGHVPEI